MTTIVVENPLGFYINTKHLCNLYLTVEYIEDTFLSAYDIGVQRLREEIRGFPQDEH